MIINRGSLISNSTWQLWMFPPNSVAPKSFSRIKPRGGFHDVADFNGFYCLHVLLPGLTGGCSDQLCMSEKVARPTFPWAEFRVKSGVNGASYGNSVRKERLPNRVDGFSCLGLSTSRYINPEFPTEFERRTKAKKTSSLSRVQHVVPLERSIGPSRVRSCVP